MGGHIIDAATVAAVTGDLDLQDTEEPTSTIKALCGEEISTLVLEVNTTMAEAAFEGSLCAFSGECPAEQTTTIRALGEKAAPLVGQVRDLISS